jgi:hypothetical protein
MKKRANTYVTILKAVYDMVEQCVCPTCDNEDILWSSWAPEGCSISVAEQLISILVEKKKITESEADEILHGCFHKVEKIIKRIESEK